MDLGRDFPESFKRLYIQMLTTIKFKVIFLVIFFILNLIIFIQGNISIVFIIFLSMDFFVFGLIILEPYFVGRTASSQLEDISITLSIMITNLRALNIIQNENEANIFRKNFESLHIFKLTNNYKYCMIAMGSMLEFVL